VRPLRKTLTWDSFAAIQVNSTECLLSGIAENAASIANPHQTGALDPATFEREIKPKLKTVSLLETMRATGLSRTYCGMIRRGVRIPHPRHWEALRDLVRSPEP
jgi:hypothetical protein